MNNSSVSDVSIEAREISKWFGTTRACDAVNFAVRWGEIHALLGENGAGKTTLMRILSGFVRPDAGTIYLDGRPIQLESPRDAMRRGIGMVHQRYRLIETFTVADNLLLGNSSAGNPRQFGQHIREIGQRFGLSIRPEAYVGDLSDGERQRVEIVRVLQRGARTLILDEPTSVLSPQECLQLFTALKRMAAEGRSIILISHKMEEVLAWCDRVTVMRRGRTVMMRATGGLSPNVLAEMTVGSSRSERTVQRKASPGGVVLKVDGVSAVGPQRTSTLKNVGFAVRAGEILGVAGLSGNGQTELAEVCAGLIVPSRGRVELQGQNIVGRDVASLVTAGVAFIPEDRLGTGVCGGLGTDENLVLRDLNDRRFVRWGIVDRAAVERWALEKTKQFAIRLPDITGPVRRLSGGNMQRVVLARELSRPHRALIAAQPTRGLDVAATEAVHQMIMDARNLGTAVLLISEDLDEITKLSDRLIVMHRGEITGEFAPDVSRERIGLAMTGVKVDSYGEPNDARVTQAPA